MQAPRTPPCRRKSTKSLGDSTACKPSFSKTMHTMMIQCLRRIDPPKAISSPPFPCPSDKESGRIKIHRDPWFHQQGPIRGCKDTPEACQFTHALEALLFCNLHRLYRDSRFVSSSASSFSLTGVSLLSSVGRCRCTAGTCDRKDGLWGKPLFMW